MTTGTHAKDKMKNADEPELPSVKLEQELQPQQLFSSQNHVWNLDCVKVEKSEPYFDHDNATSPDTSNSSNFWERIGNLEKISLYNVIKVENKSVEKAKWETQSQTGIKSVTGKSMPSRPPKATKEGKCGRKKKTGESVKRLVAPQNRPENLIGQSKPLAEQIETDVQDRSPCSSTNVPSASSSSNIHSASSSSNVPSDLVLQRKQFVVPEQSSCNKMNVPDTGREPKKRPHKLNSDEPKKRSDKLNSVEPKKRPVKSDSDEPKKRPDKSNSDEPKKRPNISNLDKPKPRPDKLKSEMLNGHGNIEKNSTCVVQPKGHITCEENTVVASTSGAAFSSVLEQNVKCFSNDTSLRRKCNESIDDQKQEPSHPRSHGSHQNPSLGDSNSPTFVEQGDHRINLNQAASLLPHQHQRYGWQNGRYGRRRRNRRRNFNRRYDYHYQYSSYGSGWGGQRQVQQMMDWQNQSSYRQEQRIDWQMQVNFWQGQNCFNRWQRNYHTMPQVYHEKQNLGPSWASNSPQYQAQIGVNRSGRQELKEIDPWKCVGKPSGKKTQVDRASTSSVALGGDTETMEDVGEKLDARNQSQNLEASLRTPVSGEIMCCETPEEIVSLANSDPGGKKLSLDSTSENVGSDPKDNQLVLHDSHKSDTEDTKLSLDSTSENVGSDLKDNQLSLHDSHKSDTEETKLILDGASENASSDPKENHLSNSQGRKRNRQHKQKHKNCYQYQHSSVANSDPGVKKLALDCTPENVNSDPKDNHLSLHGSQKRDTEDTKLSIDGVSENVGSDIKDKHLSLHGSYKGTDSGTKDNTLDKCKTERNKVSECSREETGHSSKEAYTRNFTNNERDNRINKEQNGDSLVKQDDTVDDKKLEIPPETKNGDGDVSSRASSDECLNGYQIFDCLDESDDDDCQIIYVTVDLVSESDGDDCTSVSHTVDLVKKRKFSKVTL